MKHMMVSTCKFAVYEYSNHITHAMNLKCWSNFILLPKQDVFIRYIYPAVSQILEQISFSDKRSKIVKLLEQSKQPGKYILKAENVNASNHGVGEISIYSKLSTFITEVLRKSDSSFES